jgi:glycerophosphoryl diester phosphodiesterase
LLAFKGELHVISFNPHILAELHSRAPSLPLTLALWTEWQGRQEEALLIAQQSGATTISLADTMVLDAPDWVQSAHSNGLSIHVYPVSPARGEPAYECWTAASQEAKWKKLAELGVDALISDFPRETLAGLEGL